MAVTAATVTAKTTVAGVHHWPGAPARRGYLADDHRHLFVARATVLVVHDEREVEFHDLGDDLRNALLGQNEGLAFGTHDTSLVYFGAKSCEALARAAAEQLEAMGYPVVEVSVSEDDEHTATVYCTDVEVTHDPTGREPITPPPGLTMVPDPDRTPGQEPTA